MMTKSTLIEKLDGLRDSTDLESSHWKADDLLCDFLIFLGHKDVVESYEKIRKWYG